MVQHRNCGTAVMLQVWEVSLINGFLLTHRVYMVHFYLSIYLFIYLFCLFVCFVSGVVIRQRVLR